jgi:hypothetical protein
MSGKTLAVYTNQDSLSLKLIGANLTHANKNIGTTRELIEEIPSKAF